jgi:hypothetical protein
VLIDLCLLTSCVRNGVSRRFHVYLRGPIAKVSAQSQDKKAPRITFILLRKRTPSETYPWSILPNLTGMTGPPVIATTSAPATAMISAQETLSPKVAFTFSSGCRTDRNNIFFQGFPQLISRKFW